MSYPIPFLSNILILCMNLFPTGLGATLSIVFRRNKSLAQSLLGMVAAYAIVMAITTIVRPSDVLVWRLGNPIFYIMAPVISIGALGLEYVVGWFYHWATTGTQLRGLSVHSAYAGFQSVTVVDVATILALVVGEEFILRQTPMLIFRHAFGWSVEAVIVAASIIYALNHINFGISVTIQKLVTGLIYSFLFVWSGWSILVPIIAHGTQNMILLALSRRGGNR